MVESIGPIVWLIDGFEGDEDVFFFALFGFGVGFEFDVPGSFSQIDLAGEGVFGVANVDGAAGVDDNRLE